MTSDSPWRQIVVRPPDPHRDPRTFDTERLEQVGARTAAALGSTDTALAVVRASRGVVWISDAGDAYRVDVDDLLRAVQTLRDGLDDVLGQLRALARRTWTNVPGRPSMGRVAGNWSQDSRRPRFAVASTGGGIAMRVGAGASTVDPETLDKAAVLLGDAAAELDDAQRQLVAYKGWSNPWGWDEVDTSCERVGRLVNGAFGPGRCADQARELAGSARGAAALYLNGESRAQGVGRGLGALAGWWFGENPVLRWLVPLRTIEVAGPAALGFWLASRGDPEGTGDALGEIGGAAVSSGAVDFLVGGLAGWLRAIDPRAQLPTLTPVEDVSRQFAAGLAALSRSVVVVPVVDPPQPEPSVGFGGALSLVALSDNLPEPDGSVSPTSTITIQRIDHADGSRSWLVAIPGTETLLGGQVALDVISDVGYAAGVAQALTTSVLEAMRSAGISPDEPVVLTGHSLGGMIAQSVAVAAGGLFQIRGLVTAGSPSIPQQLPAGVPVVRFEHDEDVVPHADDEPTQVTADTSVVERSLGDIRPAHFITEYQLTAELTDAQMATAPNDQQDLTRITSLLAEDGATATTTQYQLLRAERGAAPGGGAW